MWRISSTKNPDMYVADGDARIAGMGNDHGMLHGHFPADQDPYGLTRSASIRRLHDQYVALQAVEHFLGCIADENPLHPGARHRPHDHQTSPHRARDPRKFDGRLAAHQVPPVPGNSMAAESFVEPSANLGLVRFVLRGNGGNKSWVHRHTGNRPRSEE